ncbi:MAG TPA: tryptophan 2,3-dioxygenase family protein [Pyrinomonadaceae bacterium]|nr:tryptophan 2,3-dioxygenase family protein [Pyrinomonadaceae bacterium]HMP64749.1 tryptophan 2,3-dioxygenase family protein [Pyrinomonadaceae bacterium]
MANQYGENAPLSYNKYLKVPDLIGLQHTLSDPESHDELLFIIIHQTYELWFKQILHELDACIAWMGEDRLFRANHSLRSILSIERILVSQIHILETMAPIGFLEFRDKLNPASGFQSMQFREIEFASGAKDELILRSFQDDEYAYPRLEKRFSSPSLADAFWALVARMGFSAETYEDRVDAIVKLLAVPEKFPELYNMQDLLIEHDELIIAWRYNHIQMVERMLGMKRGTGGSEGVGYLMTTLKKKFFPELWEARTHLSIEDIDNEKV